MVAGNKRRMPPSLPPSTPISSGRGPDRAVLAAASCDLELDGRGAVHLHTVVWSADVEKLKRSNENVKARCFSLFTQLTDAQAHVQALETTVSSLQAMNDLLMPPERRLESHVSGGGRAGLAASVLASWSKALAAILVWLLNGLMT